MIAPRVSIVGGDHDFPIDPATPMRFKSGQLLRLCVFRKAAGLDVVSPFTWLTGDGRIIGVALLYEKYSVFSVG